MSSYPAKRLVNRYWKRPKPKIYECNIRDAERIYKDSYNQYLQSKHFYASHGTAPSDIEEEFATRWTLNRTRSALDHSGDPLSRRDGSALSAMDYGYGSTNDDSRHGRPSFTRHDSLTENSLHERPTGRARSLVQSTRDASPEAQLENIESRLERIKKLRQELGMDSHGEEDKIGKPPRRPPRGMSPSDSRAANEVSNNSYSYKSTNGSARAPSSDLYESKYSERNERSSRLSNRNGDDEFAYKSFRSARNEEEDKYSQRSTRLASKYDDDDKYTPRSSRLANKYGEDDKAQTKRSRLGVTFENDDKAAQRSSRLASKYDSDDFSSSSIKPKGIKSYNAESDFSLKSRTKNEDTYEPKSLRAKKSNFDDAMKNDELTNPDEEDELVSNIRKKFPTSDEILQKISKMDIDL